MLGGFDLDHLLFSHSFSKTLVRRKRSSPPANRLRVARFAQADPESPLDLSLSLYGPVTLIRLNLCKFPFHPASPNLLYKP